MHGGHGECGPCPMELFHVRLQPFDCINNFPWGFPGSSAGKEPACNAGDAGLIPALGKSTGEEIGYPLQHSWASLWLKW